GVAVNFLLVLAFTLLVAASIWGMRIFPAAAATWQVLMEMASFGILINLVLALFNLLPIPPLDGSHVMYHLLPPNLGMRYREMGRYGMLLVFAFLFLGGFRVIMGPLFFLYGAAMTLARFLA
ncbi:MAG TPA: site-2 protease family protein, partial [Longimicrobiaceae bacterium]|nr:site-2 protease family protein [Longimicrobiaceae bacterium]